MLYFKIFFLKFILTRRKSGGVGDRKRGGDSSLEVRGGGGSIAIAVAWASGPNG